MMEKNIFFLASLIVGTIVMPPIAADYRFEEAVREDMEEHKKHGHTISDHFKEFSDKYYGTFYSMFHGIFAAIGTTSSISAQSSYHQTFDTATRRRNSNSNRRNSDSNSSSSSSMMSCCSDGDDRGSRSKILATIRNTETMEVAAGEGPIITNADVEEFIRVLESGQPICFEMESDERTGEKVINIVAAVN